MRSPDALVRDADRPDLPLMLDFGPLRGSPTSLMLVCGIMAIGDRLGVRGDLAGMAFAAMAAWAFAAIDVVRIAAGFAAMALAAGRQSRIVEPVIETAILGQPGREVDAWSAWTAADVAGRIGGARSHVEAAEGIDEPASLDQRRPYCLPFSSRQMTVWSMPEYASSWRWVQPSATRRRRGSGPDQIEALLLLGVARFGRTRSCPDASATPLPAAYPVPPLRLDTVHRGDDAAIQASRKWRTAGGPKSSITGAASRGATGAGEAQAAGGGQTLTPPW